MYRQLLMLVPILWTPSFAQNITVSWTYTCSIDHSLAATIYHNSTYLVDQATHTSTSSVLPTTSGAAASPFEPQDWCPFSVTNIGTLIINTTTYTITPRAELVTSCQASDSGSSATTPPSVTYSSSTSVADTRTSLATSSTFTASASTVFIETDSSARQSSASDQSHSNTTINATSCTTSSDLPLSSGLSNSSVRASPTNQSWTVPASAPSSDNRVTGLPPACSSLGGSSVAIATPVPSQWLSGDGSDAPWPDCDTWMPWSQMWQINEPFIGKSCAPNAYAGIPTPNSQEETQQVREAIEYYSNISAVDPRIIFVTMMGVSQGCVRAVTTTNSVYNPGLMGSHNGTGNCYPSPDSQMSPCPSSEIYQMIYDGTQSDLADTLVQAVNMRQSSPLPQAYYEALRLYNSGLNFVIDTDLSVNNYTDAQGQEHTSGDADFVSNAANRLRGWNGS